MKSVKNILLLDTDPQSAGQIINTLSIGKDAFAVQHAGGVMEGLNYLQTTQPDLVLLDGSMLESGDFTAVQSKLSEQNIPCILLAEQAGKNIIGLAEQTGAREYVVKSGITPSHLLKTIVSTLRLSETENRLNTALEEYSGRISAFSQMLDCIHSGVVVISADSAMQYANAYASEILQNQTLNKKLTAAMTYRHLTAAESIDLPDGNITMHARPIVWDSETCNMFIIEKSEKAAVDTADLSFVFALLNGLPGQWLLLKDGATNFANDQFKGMMKNADALIGQRIETLLTTPAFREIEDTRGKGVKGVLNLGDGNSIAVIYIVIDIKIGNEVFQLLHITPGAHAGIALSANERADEGGVASASLSDMGNFNGPATLLVKNIRQMINCIAEGNLEEAAHVAQSAETGMDQMHGLISVYKSYLALSAQTIMQSTFSMKELVDEVANKLQTNIHALGAEINVSELPSITADKGLVLRVIEELLTNALQFSRKDKKPVIDIGHDKYDGSYIFCIRDNGVGVSRKDQTRIFEPFEKLDATASSIGLGLAICKNIVEKHGGKIWVESLPGHGSNFYFTLG